jgi:hypothetical protein
MSVVQHEYLANYSVDLFSTIDSSIIAQYDDVITTQAMYTQWYIGMEKKTVVASDVFLIFSPFTRRLWLSLLATIIVGGIVLYLLIIISRDEKPKAASRGGQHTRRRRKRVLQRPSRGTALPTDNPFLRGGHRFHLHSQPSSHPDAAAVLVWRLIDVGGPAVIGGLLQDTSHSRRMDCPKICE